MPFKLIPLNPSYTSISLPDGTIVPQAGIIIESLSKKQQTAYSDLVLITEILPGDELLTQLAPGGPIGYIYDGEGSINVSGIKGVFEGGKPRFDLSDDELALAATTACVLRQLENHS